MRRILAPALAPQAVAGYRPRLDAIASSLIEPVLSAGQRMDPMHLMVRLPEQVMFDLFGISGDHARTLHTILRSRPRHDRDVVDDVTDMLHALDRFFGALLAQGLPAEPGPVLSALLEAHHTGTISRRELVQNASFVLFGGVEPPARCCPAGHPRYSNTTISSSSASPAPTCGAKP